MTVQELIELLSKENPKATVYIMNISEDDMAVIATDVYRNILEGSAENVTIC